MSFLASQNNKSKGDLLVDENLQAMKRFGLPFSGTMNFHLIFILTLHRLCHSTFHERVIHYP